MLEIFRSKNGLENTLSPDFIGYWFSLYVFFDLF